MIERALNETDAIPGARTSVPPPGRLPGHPPRENRSSADSGGKNAIVAPVTFIDRRIKPVDAREVHERAAATRMPIPEPAFRERARAAAISQAAQRELARRELLPFCALTYAGGFQAPPHIAYLARLLEQVERGELSRLIVSLHPGSGKSTLLQFFAAWYLGRDPKRKIIATSAAERLVVRNSRAVRDCFTEPAWPFDAKLDPNATAQTQWETTEGGGLFGIGVGGTITGWRAPLLPCDDLEDGQSSKLELDALEEWFRGKALTRLEPGGAVVIVQTRWPNDDLPKRLMQGPRGEQWRYVRMPAIAEDNDPLGRKPGEALWPARFDVAALEAIREDIGSRHFAAQYQGAPMSDGGNVIRSEWFQRYDRLPDKFGRVVAWLDAASKTGVRNDYSAIVTIGATKEAFYVLDVVRRRVEFPELIRMTRAAHEKHRPSRIFVEDASSGVPLIQTLKSEANLPIVPIKVTTSKESRVEGVSGTIEAGKVYLPKSAPWLAEFETELCEFPAGDHDDMLDAFVGCLSQLVKKRFVYAAVIGDGYVTSVGSDGELKTTIHPDVINASTIPAERSGVIERMRGIY
jgi:predicted phage terminase large subunit-like protein